MFSVTAVEYVDKPQRWGLSATENGDALLCACLLTTTKIRHTWRERWRLRGLKWARHSWRGFCVEYSAQVTVHPIKSDALKRELGQKSPAPPHATSSVLTMGCNVVATREEKRIKVTPTTYKQSIRLVLWPGSRTQLQSSKFIRMVCARFEARRAAIKTTVLCRATRQ